MLYTPSLGKGVNKKFARFFHGPFRILELLEQNAIIAPLHNTKKQQRVHINRLKRYHGPYVPPWEKPHVAEDAPSQPKGIEHTQAQPSKSTDNKTTSVENQGAHESQNLRLQQEMQQRYNLRRTGTTRKPDRLTY